MMRSSTWLVPLGLAFLAGAAVALFCAAVPAAEGSEPSAAIERVAPAAAAPQEKKDVHPKVDFSKPCADCHRSISPAAVKDWEAGAHGSANVGCFICHGDGEVEFTVRPSPEKCYTCHSEKAVDSERMPEGGCFACHSGHRLTFHQE